MSLSPEQLQAVRTAIDADPALAAYPNNSDGAFEIARLLNAASDPAYIVWRTSVSWDEITGNGFTWTLVDALSNGTARIWEWMFRNGTNSINPSKDNIRQGVIDVWSGSAPKNAVQAMVFGHCKRTASRLEALLADGAGTTAAPSVMAYEGTISYQDVQDARAL